MLFAADKDKLAEFRAIIELLWGFALVNWRDVPPDAFTSTEFQKLAKALVADAAPFFKVGTQLATNVRGLLSSQEKWQLKHQQYFHISGESIERLPTERLKPPWKEAEGIGVGKAEMRDESGLRPKVAESIANTPSGFLISLLMAGAIFGIFITFLISFNHLRSKAYNGLAYSSSCDYSSSQWNLRAPVVQMALEHIISVLKTTNLLPLVTIDFLKTESGNAIAFGRVSGLSSLTAWLEKCASELPLDSAVLKGFRSYIRAFSDNWASSYAVQANYRLLEVYLGFKHSVSIVPHTLLRTESSQANGTGAAEAQTAIECLNSSKPSNSSISSVSSFANVATSPAELSISSFNMQHSSSIIYSPNSSPSTLEHTISDVTKPSKSPTTSTLQSRLSSSSTSPSSRRICDSCKRSFPNLGNLNRHRKDKHEKVRYRCRASGCDRHFSRHGYRQVHERDEHGIRIKGH